MIAVDTNVLVAGHRADAEFHAPAIARIRQLAEGTAPWAIPWPCLHEFYSIVTHPRIFIPPSTSDQAIAQIEAWLESPALVLLSETGGHWPQLSQLLRDGKIAGPAVHDARIAALCLSHGARELLSADRDFSRFPRLRVTNPLL